MKHTIRRHSPGPWRMDNWQNGPGPSRPVVLSQKRLVADCTPNSRVRSLSECEANARLIAAAPEMLTQLMEALHALEVVKEHFECIDQPHMAEDLNDDILRLKEIITRAGGGMR